MKINYLHYILLFFTVCSQAQNPSQIGQWSDPITFDIVPVAAANLPNGKLIVWSSKYKNSYGGADGATYTQIFDPFQGIDGVAEQSTQSNTNHDMFCPGINNLPDGRILAAGGSSSARTSLYDYQTGLWSVADEMNVPRGYQGNVTLSDGSVFTIGGSWAGERGGKYAEVWTQNTGWIPITSLTGELLTDGNNPSLDDPDPTQRIYRTDNHAWLVPAPNGKIFHAGPGTNMHWIDVNDINNPQVQDLGSRLDDVYSMNGNAAMFDVGKVLKTGGSRTYSMGAPASDLSYVIDINSETPVVTKVPGLNEARAMHNTTVLPDGTVLITGGLDSGSVFTDQGASFVGELFNPETNSWSDTAAMQEARTYHSVAILMQDGRVFVGGGGLCAGPVPDCVNHFSAEIYSPAYLFNPDGTLATRPTISAPETADYNSDINVTGSTNISEFSLVRYSSATHSTNNEQRRIPVSFTSNGGDYTVSIPNRELLPPGIYMLFSIDDNGVPSIAESIKIGTAIPIVDNPTLVLDLRFEEGSGSTIDDFSIYNNDATIIERDNNANPISLTQNYWSTNGFDGTSLEMDGSEHDSNTLVEIPYSSSLGSISKEITVMAWVYRDEIVNNASILTNDYPDLFFGFHNSLYKWAFPTTDANFVRLFSGYTPPETWVHMAATYDGKIAKLYANGVEINSEYATGEITLETVEQYFSSFTTSGFYDRRIIGNLSGITDELDGKIDELKVFNKALGEEVVDYYYELGLEQSNTLYDCTAENIITEYKIGTNGDWVQGDFVDVAEGVEVYIRAITTGNKEYMVTLPVFNGPTFSSLNDFPNFEDPTAYKVDTFFNSGDGLIDVLDTGTYVFTTIDGCPITIYVKVTEEQTCENHIQEYKINGVWQSGEEVINVSQGDQVILSALPNIDGLLITLPDGSQVGDNFNLGNVNFSDAGFYTLTSIYGCEITLQIIVNGMPPLPCAGDANISPQYTINGLTESGLEEITVAAGDELVLSIVQENVGFTITLPDGTDVVGDYDLGNVITTQSGVYTFGSDLGCIKTLDVTINEQDPTCASNPMDMEYIINGVSGSGSEAITIAVGDELVLSILQEGLNFDITLPDETVVIGDYDLGNVTIVQSGDYIFESDLGCIKTLNINIVEPFCESNPLSQEYKINGVWQSGEEVININQGDQVILSALPNGVELTITLPDGSQVGDNYSLGSVDVSQSGVYTIESEFGCVITLDINIEDPNADPICDIYPMDLEYIINGVSGTGLEAITINEGDELVLSIVQENLDFAITLPDGTVVVGDYDLGNVTIAQSGLYTFESDLECIKTLDITVNELDPICVTNPMNIEYIINNVSGNGLEDISLNEGDELVLSIIEADSFTITLPDDTDIVGDYDLGTVTIAQSGLYTFESDLGCIKTLNINIVDGSVCATNPLSQEYKINGVWQSGEEVININQGDEVILSALPNGVGLTITLPDGSQVGDNYSLGNVDVSQSGVYTIESEFGCIITLDINIDDPNANPCIINPMDLEYIINSVSGSGLEAIAVTEGDELELSILQSGLGFTITLPDGNDVIGDYDLGNVIIAQSGIYTFESDLGCIKTLDITVNEQDPICDTNPMDIEYIINSVSGSGLENISLNEGDELVLSIAQSGLGFTITLPDGTDVVGDYDLGAVTLAQSGLYTFESDLGCIKTLNINIVDVSACATNPLSQEYKINGVWQSGADVINVNEGDEVILSALPNDVGITITLPDGNQVGDNYSLGNVAAVQSGVYTLESEFGCIITLNINIEVPNANPCTTYPMDMEYIINSVSGSDSEAITVAAGDELVLSIVQVGLGFTITLPDGTLIVGDHDLGNVVTTQSGVYTFESDLGCIKTLSINIVDEPLCELNPLSQEYKINGVWQSGADVINVNEGDEVVLSALPNEVALTITLPDGSQVGDNYSLGNVTIAQSGVYTIASEFGCVITLDINIANGASKISETKSTLSTTEESSESNTSLKVYPNPAHTFVDVYGYKGSKILIFNVLGITLKTIENTKSSKTRINLDGIPSGVYFLRNTINDRVETKRIVID